MATNQKSILTKIRNYMFPTFASPTPVQQKQNAKNPSGYISPVQFQRLQQDIATWRAAIAEAEQAYFPHRVKMMRIFQDTVLNGQITAAIDRRVGLTLLKDMVIMNGDKQDDRATEIIQKDWFHQLSRYILESRLFYGYGLIALGDMVNDEFPRVQLLKRQNVSPDRFQLTNLVYQITGMDFRKGGFKDETGQYLYDWTIYVDSPTETAGSICGFGLLCKLAYYELLLRANTGYNATNLELFGIPIRKGTTTKTDEYERATFAQALSLMGNQGWILLDPTDSVDLVEAGGSGGAGKGDRFASFEERMLKMINKVVLGHADAIDSETGKLGTNDAVKEAIKATSKLDNRWFQQFMNEEVIPKLQNIGLPIPVGAKLVILNDEEKEETRVKEDTSNKVTADIFKTIVDAGGDPDWKYFEERTGIPVKKAPEPPPMKGGINQKVLARLNELYGGTGAK